MIALVALVGGASAILLFALGRYSRAALSISGALGLLQAALLFAIAGPGLFGGSSLGSLNRVALLGIALSWGGAALYGSAYYASTLRRGKITLEELRETLALTQVFVTALAVAAISRDLAVAWVALEVTTIVGAFLVAARGKAERLEAAWKFAVLCFAGVGFGLVGIGLLAAAAGAAGTSAPTDLQQIKMSAAHMAPLLARLGLAALIAGFGTKAGLVPLHWWLPDAHSQSPAPVSALMSGGLLATALVVLMEVRASLAPLLGANAFGPVLIVMGLCGLALAVFSMLRQQDIKRLLAFSSVEHMAVMAIALGIGTPLAVAAFCVHIVGHALAKSSAFLSVGGLVESAGSHRVRDIAGSIKLDSASATAALASIGALLGFPPSLLFASETILIFAAFRAGQYAVAGAVMLLLCIAFAAITERSISATLGSRASKNRSGKASALPAWSALVPLGLLVVSAWLLLSPPAWSMSLLGGAVYSITGRQPW